jgi:hypothetical protein
MDTTTRGGMRMHDLAGAASRMPLESLAAPR